MDSSLLALEHDYYLNNNDSTKATIVNKKINILLANNILNERTLNEYLRIDANFLIDSLRPTYFWNAALVAFLNKNNSQGYSFLKQYENISKDTSINYFILKTLIVSKLDTSNTRIALNKIITTDKDIECPNCIIEINNYKLKGKEMKIAFSAIIPGLGAIVNGNVLKGFTSLVITTGAVALTYYLLQNKCYANALGWGLTWGSKFYIGNIRLTEKLIEKKESRKKNELTSNCELVWKKLLDKYPIQLK